jgi:hypothetical protein
MSWYYAKGAKRVGPLTLEEFVAAAQTGALLPTDQIWTEGMPCWLPADTVPDLFSAETPHPLLKPVVEPPKDPDPLTRMIIPVGRSGWAIAAGYLGLISVLIFPAPFALVIGIVAVRDIGKHPHRHGMGRAIFGIVMGSLGTAVLALSLLGLMLAPHR